MIEAPHHLRVDFIELGNDRARDLDLGHAEALADSIRMQGLLYPVLVRPIADGGFRLVDGRHRLEAFKLLGLETVPVVMSDKVSDDEAMLDQVMANLARRMAALDFCRHLFMLKQAWLRLHPEAAAGGDRRSDEFKSQSLAFDPATGEPIGFDGAMAEKFNLGRSTIKEAVAIWTGLSPTTRQTLHGMKLSEKKTELKALSSMSPVRQEKVLDLILGDDHPDISNVAGALAFLGDGVQLAPLEKRYRVVSEGIKALPDESFDRLVMENQERLIVSLRRQGRI